MIKYHYYGLKGNYGYSTVACSELISDSLLINMKSVAERFSSNSGYSKQQMHMFNDGGNKIIGSIFEFPPQEGEKRSSFFCQQYILDEKETEKYLLKLPKVVSGLKFVTERSNQYVTSSEDLPLSEIFWEPDIDEYSLKQLVQAAMEVTLDTKVNRQLFIVSDSWDKGFDAKGRNLLAKITEYLPLECRRRLGYVTYSNGIEGMTMLFKIVCCRSDDAAKFKDLYKGKSCYYYNVDTKRLSPETEIGSYVSFVFNNYDKIHKLIFDCDYKLSKTDKTDVNAYNSFCDIYEQEGLNSEEVYLKKRDVFLRSIFSFYTNGTVNKEVVNNVFKNELSAARRNSIKFENGVYEMWLKFFEGNILSKQDILDYLFIYKENNNKDIDAFISKNGIRKDYYRFCISQHYYPEILTDEIISAVKGVDIHDFSIDHIISEWGVEILYPEKVAEALSSYFSEQVNKYAGDERGLKEVYSKSHGMIKYDLNSGKLEKIASKAEREIKEQLEIMKKNKMLEEEQRRVDLGRDSIRDSFKVRLEENTIGSILDKEFLEEAERAIITKRDLDKIAMSIFKENNSPTALLFLICNFKTGSNFKCDMKKFNEILNKNKKGSLKNQYQFLQEVASLSDFKKYKSLSSSILSYIKSNIMLYIYIKLFHGFNKNNDKLSYLLNPKIEKHMDKPQQDENDDDMPSIRKDQADKKILRIKK